MSKLELGPVGMTVEISADGRHLLEAAALEELGSGYRASFTRMGFTGADVASLSDELVDQLVTWGNAGAIMARVNEYLRAGADQVALTVLGNGPHPATDTARQLARHLPV